jgi:hypothetical protein
MESVASLLKNNWLLLASLSSIFWGVRSAYLFGTKAASCWTSFFVRSYQFIFNFVGSFAGWCCLYVLLLRINNVALATHDFTGGDVLLFLLSLFGLTGHLPQATYGLVQAVESLAQKAIEKMTGV